MTDTDLVYVVITDGDGPFETGELLVCAELPGGSVREIGYPSRKPLKWDCDYERFSDPLEATSLREQLRASNRHWVPVDS